MVSIKVLNGTPESGETLCRSCRYVHRQQGYRYSEEVIHCDYSSPMRRILFNVRACTEYADRNHPTRYDMEKVAWVLEIKGGKPIGFTPPQSEDVC